MKNKYVKLKVLFLGYGNYISFIRLDAFMFINIISKWRWSEVFGIIFSNVW